MKKILPSKKSTAVKTDGAKQGNELETLNCDDKAPTNENVEKDELCKENNPSFSSYNENSHLPILPFVAGYLLASRTSNMNYSAKPNVLKKPYTNNIIPYREKMSVELVAVVVEGITVELTVTIVILPIK